MFLTPPDTCCRPAHSKVLLRDLEVVGLQSAVRFPRDVEIVVGQDGVEALEVVLPPRGCWGEMRVGMGMSSYPWFLNWLKEDQNCCRQACFK